MALRTFDPLLQIQRINLPINLIIQKVLIHMRLIRLDQRLLNLRLIQTLIVPFQITENMRYRTLNITPILNLLMLLLIVKHVTPFHFLYNPFRPLNYNPFRQPFL